MKKILVTIPVITILLLFCVKANAQGTLPDSLICHMNTIDTGQVFRTGYFTGFARTTINSFFEDESGDLHIAYVDNYELFYFKSTDDGLTWSKVKIITGHEGDIRMATLTVDNNGKVFIGFTSHQYYNYANPTSVTFGYEFYFNLYCVNNLSGSWVVENVASYDPSNFGPLAENIYADSDNNIHLFANRYGWMSMGGEAWEYVRSSATNTWGPKIIVCQFDDAGIDRFIYDYYIVINDTMGRRALIAARNKSDAPKLFYVLNDGSGWEAPFEICDNIAVAWNRFDALINPSDTLYIAFLYKNLQGLPELRVSKDTGTPVKANINLTSSDTLDYFKIHCNNEGKFTMYLWIKNKNVHVSFSDDCMNWTDPIPVPDNLVKYFSGSIVKTNTRKGYYTEYCKQINVITGPRSAQPYGPDTLVYGDLKLEISSSIQPIGNFPSDYILEQNYPNPFNPETKICFSIPITDFVELKVFNMLGVEVATLVNKELTPGNYNFNLSADGLSSGIYFYSIKTSAFNQVKKMVLLK
jgi:hypothetical protein